jgi:hypothetical protein
MVLADRHYFRRALLGTWGLPEEAPRFARRERR